MAVDITIHLTDAEQAKVSEWLDLLKPGLTPAQKLALLEAHARRLLRDELTYRVMNRNINTYQEQARVDMIANRNVVPAPDDLIDPASIPPPEG